MTAPEVTREQAAEVARMSDGYSSSVDVCALARTVVALHDELEDQSDLIISLRDANQRGALENDAMRSCIDRLRDGCVLYRNGVDPDAWLTPSGHIEPLTPEEQAVMSR